MFYLLSVGKMTTGKIRDNFVTVQRSETKRGQEWVFGTVIPILQRK